MQREWQTFLQQAGARINEGRVADFGDPVTELAHADESVIADLSHFSLLAARGEETAQFLQGQLTNDVRAVTASHSQLTGHCTPKGRLLALFRLFRHRDAYLLQLPAERAAPLLKRLRLYVLRSKVMLEDVSDQWARFGLAGPRADQWLREIVGNVPEAINDTLALDGVTLVRVAGETPRFELLGDAAALQPIWQQLAALARPVGADVWSLLNIRAGLPQVYDTTSEAFVPQMLNLHSLDGVSFRKGCYTGQEIVARMQYLGKLKRRMFLAHVPGGVPPEPGDELFSVESESGQGTGKVVDARPAPDGGYDLLAVIYVAAVESNAAIHVRDPAGPLLRIRSLPYLVDELGTASAQH